MAKIITNNYVNDSHCYENSNGSTYEWNAMETGQTNNHNKKKGNDNDNNYTKKVNQKDNKTTNNNNTYNENKCACQRECEDQMQNNGKRNR